MSQTPRIFGQAKPLASIDTTLFIVAANTQAQFTIYVCNQTPDMDKINIGLVPFGQNENSASYIAYQTAVIGNSVLSFSGLFLSSGDQVQVFSTNGTTSFVATGLETA